jgi:hypothetical protein
VQFNVTPSGTAGADDSFRVDDLQVEVVASASAVASAYVKSDLNSQLTKAMRFWEQTCPQGENCLTGATANGALDMRQVTTNTLIVNFPLRVVKRVTPTVSFISPSTGTTGKCYDATATADLTMTSQDIGDVGFSGISGSGTSGDQIKCHMTADSRI